MDDFMSKEDLDKISLMSSALFIFCDEPIVQIDKSEYTEDLIFFTSKGQQGLVEESSNGNYNVWLEEELIYEIEREVFSVISIPLHAKKVELTELYRMVEKVKINQLKKKSRDFMTILLYKAETLILNPSVPIEKSIRIGTNFAFADKTGNKFIINLN